MVLIYRNTAEKIHKKNVIVEKLERQFRASKDRGLENEIARIQSQAGGVMILPAIGVAILMATTMILVFTLKPNSRRS
ncbi:hypothetical protein H7X65_01005 [Candidatus Parcubacteria bacterium]|nr:hypothetical protein [Candidatus Parcubacteria bacterium]